MNNPNKNQLQQRIDKIVLLIDLRRIEHAQRLLFETLAFYPDKADLYLLQGQCFEMSQEKEAAIEAYLKALSLDPDNHLGHYQLVNLYKTKGDKKLAKKHLIECLRLEPNNAGVLGLASLFYANEHPTKSKQYLKAALAIDPNDIKVKQADAYHSLMSFKIGRLKRIIIRNMMNNPTSAASMFSMGLVELSNGNFTNAIDLLRQSYVKKPSEEKLDAWIDARLGAYWPFKWTIRPGWISYIFGIEYQLFAFLIFTNFFLWLTVRLEPHYDNWIWLIHFAIAVFLGFTYVLKYPIQYIYRLNNHPEAPKLTKRDFKKFILFICTIVYGIVIFTKEVSLLLGCIFFLIYLPLWHVVNNHTHWFPKSISYFLYGLSWTCFILNGLGELFNWNLPRLITFPAVMGWLAILSVHGLSQEIGK
jgi:tetratricopeptide (TPR) repeat protein